MLIDNGGCEAERNTGASVNTGESGNSGDSGDSDFSQELGETSSDEEEAVDLSRRGPRGTTDRGTGPWEQELNNNLPGLLVVKTSTFELTVRFQF